jgi:hypothetical protein
MFGGHDDDRAFGLIDTIDNAVIPDSELAVVLQAVA